MATTNRTTKLKLEKPIAGEQVLDLVISYINDVEDRNSLSLVSRKFYEIEGITRKHITANTLFSNPSRLSKRFPFIESITIEGLKRYDLRVTPWIKQLALEFRSLKELHIRKLVVLDEDLETLARTRGKDLRSLKISKCEGFTMDGLRHVSTYCNQLRTFCLRYPYYIDVEDRVSLHELALNSTVLERLHVPNMNTTDAEDLIILLAKKCCNSLISLKIGDCCLSKLGDAFRYAVRLEHFGGNNCYEESHELVGFRFPPNLRSLSIEYLPVTLYSIVLPFLNRIRKLKLLDVAMDEECQYSLLMRCPNLEVLETEDVFGDKGLQIIGKFCKKLRKLSHNGLVTHEGHELATHVGLIALAKGCTKLECLKLRVLEDISNEAIKCLGTHLKYLRKFYIHFDKEDGTNYLPLDNGIRAMLLGCSKLERLEWHGGLTDVGLEYIGKYGRNLRFLSLTHVGQSNAGLVKLSEGCPKLRKLKLMDCPFSQKTVTDFVFNMPSLRYVKFSRHGGKFTVLALIRPEFQL